MAVDGDLQQEHGGLDQILGHIGHARGVGGDGRGHAQGRGPADDVHPAGVQGGLAAPEVHVGVLAVAMQVIQQGQIALGGNFLGLEFLQVPAVQKTLVAPLAAGVAAQVADVGDADGQLPDGAAQARGGSGRDEIKEHLVRFQGGQTGRDPGRADHLHRVFEDGADIDTAALCHD